MRKFFLSLLAGLSLSAAAQGMPEMPQLPKDSAVVMGTLPNGLTYMIRHNEYPKGQADFYIAQKVGSVLEEDNQRGLAHFLEHMCFNGTKNFPGNSLVSWLESKGIKFGAQLNAYTGTDETVYNITNVPTANTAVTDSVLLILHDWANDLLLDPAEIDKERNVIHQEWRRSNVGQMRILEQALPKIFPGSQYGHRLPIGTMEVVDNFPPQALRDYYEKWYRPDLQGIIICGDIDVARTEEVIKKMFGSIEMPANAAPRTIFPVPDTPGTIFAGGNDKEQTNSIVYLIFKQDQIPVELRNTPLALTFNYVFAMIDMMLNERFTQMMSSADTPFAFAQASYDDFILANTKAMFSVIGAAKDGNVGETLKAMYREVLRAARGGFTSTEYDRARAEWLSAIEKRYNNRLTAENGELTDPMIRHFLDGEDMMSIDDYYTLMSQSVPMIPVEAINQAFAEMITQDNRVVMLLLPEEVTMPSEAELAAMMQSVDGEEIEVFSDNVRTDPLIPSLAKAGSIKKQEKIKEFEGTECWTLSNGAKVYVKQTNFKNDEISFSAVAPGGLHTTLKSATPANVIALREIFGQEIGIGAYNNADLQKYLAGKKVSLRHTFGFYDTDLKGSATPKDLPTLFELIYGTFTAPTFHEEEFAAHQSLYINLLQNQAANPQYIFMQDVAKSSYKSPYRQTLTVDDVKNSTRQGLQDIVRSQFNDASKWSFSFVGNFDPAQLRQLCEQYIASLPSSGKGAKRVTKADTALEINAGSATDTYTTTMETPQTWVMVCESASVPYNSVNAKLTAIVGQILSARLLKTIREEMGAVYSIHASADISETEGLNTALMVPFPMDPAKKQEVLDAIKAEINSMATNITDEELNKVKEYMVKSYAEKAEQNDAWASYITQWVASGSNNFSQAIEQVNAITPTDVQNFIATMNKQGNYRVVILDPKQ